MLDALDDALRAGLLTGAAGNRAARVRRTRWCETRSSGSCRPRGAPTCTAASRRCWPSGPSARPSSGWPRSHTTRSPAPGPTPSPRSRTRWTPGDRPSSGWPGRTRSSCSSARRRLARSRAAPRTAGRGARRARRRAPARGRDRSRSDRVRGGGAARPRGAARRPARACGARRRRARRDDRRGRRAARRAPRGGARAPRSRTGLRFGCGCSPGSRSLSPTRLPRRAGGRSSRRRSRRHARSRIPARSPWRSRPRTSCTGRRSI